MSVIGWLLDGDPAIRWPVLARPATAPDRPEVLRVCVTAPLSARASRMASALGLSDQEAAKSLRRSDAGRASYLKRVYGVGTESPTDYDVVINTERLTPDAAADLILGLVQARPATPPPATAPARASGD